MFITRLSLRNFRSFEKADLSLSKITLVTGPNSTGKSSLLYAMLAPLQSEAFPFNLAANGKYVNMGDYREMVFRNDRKKRIGIEITAAGKNDDDQQSLVTEWIFEQKWKMPKLCHLRVTSRFEQIEVSFDKSDRQYILNLDYDPSQFKGESAEMAGVIRPLLLFEKMQEESVSEENVKSGGREFDLLKPYHISGYKFKTIEKLFEQIPFMGVLHHITVLLDDVNYISSFNIEPQRTYYHSTSQARKVDKNGKNYIEQIYEWERQGDRTFNELNMFLKDLDLAYAVKTRELNSGQYEIRVRVSSKGVWSLLSDAGFALSGILPILVADLQLRDNSTLFLSQPEKQLYPNAQAALGDFLIKQAQTRGKRYVLETNSASLLNRFRSYVMSGTCEPDDISVYYLDRQSATTSLRQISFRKDGQIENAPESFIEDYRIE
jgi:predicted ATPase